MSLPTRPLGTSGLEITRVGLGAWAIGGGDWEFGWGPQDDQDSIGAMHRAVELGVNWIDTAAIYGHGRSEKVVGRFLKELPKADRPQVFTKCGVTGAIAGARSADQVDGWIGAASLALTAAIERSGAGEGPARA